MTKPEPGDKVRVTYEGIYTKYGTVLHSSRLSLGFEIPSGSTVEVLESADDPSKDPVGTVADLSSGCPIVKIGPDQWVTVWPGRPSSKVEVFSNGFVKDRKVIGAAPGTPAAEPRCRYFQEGDYGHVQWRVQPDGTVGYRHVDNEWEPSVRFESLEQLLATDEMREVDE
jgi:hypothetical protein